MNSNILNSISSIEITSTSETSEVVSFMNDILNLQDVGYDEGLLALEEEVQKDYYKENPGRKILKEIILCITDGWESEVIEDIFVTRFFSSKMTAVDALCYILALYGSLAIQNGYTREQLEAQLLAIVPDDVKTKYKVYTYSGRFSDLYESYERCMKTVRKKSKDDNSDGKSIFVKDFLGNIPSDLTIQESPDLFNEKNENPVDYSSDSELPELVSALICNLPDGSLQYILGFISRRDLALALTVLTDKAKEKVYSNISARYASEINRMIEELPDTEDTENAVIDIFNKILKREGMRSGRQVVYLQNFMKTVRKYNNGKEE